MENHSCPICMSASREAPPISGHPMRRCAGCDFVFAANRAIPEDLYAKAYSDDADYNAEIEKAKAQAKGQAGFDWMQEWVIDRLRPSGSKRILDLGCGVGGSMFLAKRAGWVDANGQDLSEEALGVARAVFGINTFSASVGELALRGEKFDAITAFNLLEHVPDPLQYMQTVRELLTDSGEFGIVVPNYDSYAMRHTTYKVWLPPFHVNFFTPATLRSLLKRVGLHVTEETVRFASWSGIEGGKAKKLALAPYLVANALIGRLRGNAVLAIARVQR